MTSYDAKELAGLILIIGAFILMFSAAFGIAESVLTGQRFQIIFGLAGSLLIGGGVWEWLSNISVEAAGDTDDDGNTNG